MKITDDPWTMPTLPQDLMIIDTLCVAAVGVKDEKDNAFSLKFLSCEKRFKKLA